jgi:hypothetical protein
MDSQTRVPSSKTGLEGFSIFINKVYVLEIVLGSIHCLKSQKSPFKMSLYSLLYNS